MALSENINNLEKDKFVEVGEKTAVRTTIGGGSGNESEVNDDNELLVMSRMNLEQMVLIKSLLLDMIEELKILNLQMNVLTDLEEEDLK